LILSENAFVSELTGDALASNSSVPPSEIVADEIEAALAAFKERADALVKSAAEREVTDNDSIGRAADVRSMIQTLSDAVWMRAREIAEPHQRAVSTAKTRTERFLADLVGADQQLMQRIADCRHAQRQRAAAQAAEQRAREAELRAAAPEPVSPQIDSAPVSLPAVRGDYGSRIGDRAVTTFTYADPTKLPLEVLNAPAVAKAIQAALRAYAKLNPNIPGVTANADLATSHRRPN
jgi:hypothetical protein